LFPVKDMDINREQIKLLTLKVYGNRKDGKENAGN
jgi:hypothetical protein